MKSRPGRLLESALLHDGPIDRLSSNVGIDATPFYSPEENSSRFTLPAPIAA